MRSLVVFATLGLLCVLCAYAYEPPAAEGALFSETFQDDWQKTWKFSADPKFSQGTWEVGAGKEEPGIAGDVGLIVKNAARHHAISALFEPPINPAGKELVVQYEVRLHNNLQCGGAYIKLLQHNDSFTPESFTNESPYAIMFGPDKCGTTDKVHFIFRHKNPVSGEYEEKHLKFPPTIKNDRNTHLYTLVIRPDNSFEIFIDLSSAAKGSLLEDFTPPVNPPKEIDDPSDIKPEDWVDEAKIPDPDDRKPADWDEDEPPTIVDTDAKKPDGWLDDEPARVPDPEMKKPDDWDDETDGAWEAPLIDNPKCSVGCGEWVPPYKPNPKYKGKWSPRLIDNPAYKGEWAPRKIPNPNYFEDNEPHKLSPIGAIGIENWTMQDEIQFDNFFIGHDAQAATNFAEKTWRVKFQNEKSSEPVPSTTDSTTSSYHPYLAPIMNYFEQYPVTSVLTAVVGAMTLLFIFARVCTKDAEAPAEPEPANASTTGRSASDSSADAEDEKKETEEKAAEPEPAAVAAQLDGDASDQKETTTKRKKRSKKDA